MKKSKSEEHLDRNLKESFENVSFPHKFLTGHLAILKKYTKNGNISGLDELNKTL